MQPLDHPIVCPILVGRAPHLEALERLLGQAVEHRGQTLLVAGEAGVGKSRFVAEARARAARRGVTVLEGYCLESHRSLPYAPLIDLLRTAAHAGRPAGAATDRLVEAIGPGAVELVRILPELAPLLPGPTPAPEPGEPEKHRLFRALADAVHRLAAARPTLVIVEDAHWSDDASLDFLGELARRLVALPILLLVTYRDDEVPPALSKFLAGLDRQRLAAELRLARLDRAEVDELLRATCGLERQVGPAFLETMYSLTDGNPFFIEEVLRSLVAAGDVELSATDGAWLQRPIGQLRVPRSVRDAVERRAERLGAPARHALSLAAVVGQRFDLELLLALTGGDEAGLVRSIKELLAAGLVVEESADRFAFRHALTREAIRASLLARERKALHREVAGAIERVRGPAPAALEAHAADLAYHYSAAEVWERVLRYAPRAGRRALALHAPRAAVEHFTRALEAERRLGIEPAADLLRACGQAYETLGDFAPARAAFEAALERARAAGDRYAEWQALVDLGAAWTGRSYERSGEYFRAALALARQIGERDPRILARTLDSVGNWHTNLEQPGQAVRHHEEALSLFRAADDRRGVAEALNHLGMASFLGGDLFAAQAHIEQAVALLRELDHRRGLASALATLGIVRGASVGDLMAVPPTDPGRPQRDAEAALEVAREIEWRAGEAYALSCVANTCLTTGAYTRAAGAARAALRLAEGLDHREWIVHAECTLAMLSLDLLAPAAARAHADRAMAAAPETASLYWTRVSAALAALASIEQGDPAGAGSLLRGVVDLGRAAQTWAERAIWYAHARLALATGDPATALRLTDALIAAEPNAAPERPVRRLLSLRGEALTALGRLAEAEAVLLAARRAAAERGARPALWRIEAARGRLYAAQGRRPEADAAFAAARAVVEGLVAEVPEGSLRDGFRQRATDLLPRPRPLTRRQAAKQASGGLTARERDVAALVGRGKSNREIAAALVLSERTVQTHVSHILDKLDFASRAQIAAWAADRGLLDDPDTEPDADAAGLRS
jgi:predicted ATPase/DNA-binding CsgD family transcriptional regulator